MTARTRPFPKKVVLPVSIMTSNDRITQLHSHNGHPKTTIDRCIVGEYAFTSHMMEKFTFFNDTRPDTSRGFEAQIWMQFAFENQVISVSYNSHRISEFVPLLIDLRAE